MGQLFTRINRNSEVTSERQLRAAQDVVDFLRQNVAEDGLFRLYGQIQTRNKILTTLLRGDRILLRQLLKREIAIEVAAAFQLYVQCFKEPLLPIRVQELLVDNPGVPEEVIAEDALGLLHQELSGTHLQLVKSVLELLHKVIHNTNRSELSSLSLPTALLPTFFNVRQPWSRRWQQVAAIFNEMIMQAPEWPYKRQNCRSNSSNNISIHDYSTRLSVFEPRPIQLGPIQVA